MFESGSHTNKDSFENSSMLFQEPKRSRSPLFIVLFLIVALIGGGAFYYLKMYPKKPPVKPVAQTTKRTTPKPKRSPTPQPAPTQEKKPQSVYSLALESDPEGAQVFSDGKKVGVTPCTLKQSSNTIALLSAGYVPYILTPPVEKKSHQVEASLTQSSFVQDPLPANCTMIYYKEKRNNGFKGELHLPLTQSWSIELNAKCVASPIGLNNKLYLSTKESLVVCLDATNGEQVWEHQGTGGTEISPIVFQGELYAGSNTSTIKVFNVNKGKERAEVSLPAYIGASPITDNTALFIVTGLGSVHSFTLKKNTIKKDVYSENWKFSSPDKVITTPLISGANLYVASTTTLYAVNKSSGDLAWEFSGTSTSEEGLVGGMRLAESVRTTPPSCGLCKKGILYINKEFLYCVNDGSEVWRCDVGDTITTTPISSQNMVFIGDTSGTLWALDEASGRVVWKVRMKGSVTSTPLIIGQHLLVGTERGLLAVIDVFTAEQVTSVELDSPIYASPLLLNDHIFVITLKGAITAFSYGA